jgi:ParB/RepB/Spo0J family partition protein
MKRQRDIKEFPTEKLPVQIANIALRDIAVSAGRMRKLRPEVVDELAESIESKGLLQPIVVRPRGAEYELVAGRHRMEAVRKCGHNSIPSVVLDGFDADHALLVEIDENLIRADLSPAERALHIGKRKEIYEKLRPETKHGTIGRGRKKSSQNEKSFVDDTAKKSGKPRSTVARDVARANKVKVLREIAGTSLDQGDEIDALAGLPEAEQHTLAARAQAGERVSAKHVAKKLKRQARERQLATATEAASRTLSKKLYGVIYADPPWRFHVHAETGVDHLADNHYPTLAIEEIKAFAVPMAGNAALFLWATVPMLPQAFDVMQTWGFTYKSLITWNKDREGLGYWVRNRVELLLIGTRGNVPAPTPGEQPPQVVEAPRGRHSEKPVIFAEMIERLFPNVPKIEMFARTAREGWDAWGNEMSEAAE